MGRWRNSAVVPLAIATLLLATTSCSGPPDNVQVNIRTLLTYSAGSTRADAALEGVLHANSGGSIVVDGTTYTLGSAIQPAGGVGRSPHPNPCGQHVQCWYV